MKKIISMVMVIILLISMCVVSYASGKSATVKRAKKVSYYPSLLIVTEVNDDYGYVLMTDVEGNEWELDGDNREYHTGDRLAVIFNDFGTTEVYDDEIVMIKNCGR